MVGSRTQEVRARVVRVTIRVEDRVAPLLVLTVVLVLQLEGVQLEGVREVEIEMMAKIKGLGTRLVSIKSPMKLKMRSWNWMVLIVLYCLTNVLLMKKNLTAQIHLWNSSGPHINTNSCCHLVRMKHPATITCVQFV